ncbi:MAG: aldehyde ferredoxin oxidoreductase family protein [Nitrososphaerota archaeon]|nr:aldehyde ferredoxin oxidoreductase family protein [Nitrososphaerales archaeon]MDW8044331.1 aldehyde ferredoxin oxidoreductase family protein [Nitrososphaerota archaeon]
MSLEAIPSKILYIDLSSRSFWVKDRHELFQKYLGGAGVAIKLLHEEIKPNVDPLSADNVIVFTVGPLTGMYPLASKTVAMFKSPLTGNLGESHAGGRSAISIRMAGYGGIVIKGASDRPIYLAIHGDKVSFRDASTLWGMRSSYTVGRVLREFESGAGIRSIMRIGRAGERLVSYACVVTETYRHFGRLGLGAVWGSKRLKALVISGRRSIKPKDPKLYREVYNSIFDAVTKSPLMKKYHELGTSMNITPLNKLRALPTRNLKEAHFEDADKISGEAFAERFLGRRVACAHCPVSCIHLAILREPYVTEPYFYKTTMISYDYELIYALGSMLRLSSPEGLLKLIDEVEKEGLDAMSCGVALAWATEMLERGLITKDDLNGITLKWGDFDSYIRAVDQLVEQSTEFYKALAKGVEYASKRYGGEEFALSFGGNEMPGYHTGPAAHIGYLTGARHSHLDGAGYSIDEKSLASNVKLNVEQIVDSLIKEESWRQILSSLVICYFARGIYRPDMVVKALKPLGYDLNEEDLNRLGIEILREKYRFKFREGFDIKKLKLPKRVSETPSPSGQISPEFVMEGVNLYIKKLNLE